MRQGVLSLPKLGFDGLSLSIGILYVPEPAACMLWTAETGVDGLSLSIGILYVPEPAACMLWTAQTGV